MRGKAKLLIHLKPWARLLICAAFAVLMALWVSARFVQPDVEDQEVSSTNGAPSDDGDTESPEVEDDTLDNVVDHLAIHTSFVRVLPESEPAPESLSLSGVRRPPRVSAA